MYANYQTFGPDNPRHMVIFDMDICKRAIEPEYPNEVLMVRTFCPGVSSTTWTTIQL